MVGLKTFWISILALFLLGACVPKTKQTECGTNEAFNAALRTCVPIVGGPSSFINVSSFAPLSAITRYKDDVTTMTFQVTVSNPYNQSYSVEWERVFNAATTSMCSDQLSCSFPASLLGNVLGEVGTHVLIAKIKDGNGTTVDTHNFEIRIVDLPRPIINAASVIPTAPNVTIYPDADPIQFSFTIRNNNATMDVTQNYRTDWSVTKNGTIVNVLDESDVFTVFTTGGTNTAYYGNSPTPRFDPGGAEFGVGSYVVRAIVRNDVPGEIVDEKIWSITIEQPPLANVTTISDPAPGVAITAHHGIDYNDFPTQSWVYGGTSTQPNFCVEIDDRDGTYPGDGESILVKFYLDSLGGDICTKRTLDTPGTQTICLIDANDCVSSVPAPFDTNILRFTNPSANVQLMHRVTARLFDEATTYEFQRSNVVPSNGSYPIEWNVLVNPVNTPPVISFGTTNPTGCVSSGANSVSNCQVDQGTPFTVSFTVADDFFSPASDPEEFGWDVNLKLNGADVSTPPHITSCSKALGAGAPAYGTQWTCALQVPHYVAQGALNPNGPFQVVATARDSGSPVGGIGATSNTLTWNLIVTEKNEIVPNITISAQTNLAASSHISRDAPLPIVYFDPGGSDFATEMETVTFRIGVRDPELDDFQYTIYRCGTGSTPAVCNTPVMISGANMNYLRWTQPPVTLPFIDTVNTDPVLVNALLYQLPETLLLDIGHDVDLVTSRPVYFRVDVADKPSVLPLASVKSDSEIFALYVRNYNPAPVINVAGANPAPNTLATPYPVVAGYPFSINPGSVTDPSLDSDEGTIVYQWYASGDAGTTWAAIAGATQKNLTWTPDHSAPASIELKLCVGDSTIANPILDPNAGGNCTAPTWFIDPKSYLVAPSSPNDVSSEVAVWHDIDDGEPTQDVIYSAYIGADNRIYVNKTVREAGFALNTSSFAATSFDALPSGASGFVKSISLAGTRNSLYISYLASSASTPNNMVPRLRRIDKAFDNTVTGEKTALAHKGKFGFNYLPYNVDVSGCSTCTFTAGTDAGYPTIQFSAGVPNGETIQINGETFTAVAAPTTANEFCSVAICSANDTASSLAAKINAHTNSTLQGLTASSNGGNTVTMSGQSAFDYLDWDGSTGVSSLTAGNNGYGKIFVVGNYWFIPMVNGSLPGSQQNNISIISGQVDIPLQNIAVDVDEGDILTSIGQVAAFDSKLNSSDDLIIASISGDVLNAGRARVSRFQLTLGRNYEPFSGPAITQLDLFGTKLFEDIKVAADTTNNNFLYVMAKERFIDGGEYNIGRYASNLTGVPSESLLATQLSAIDDTADVISDTLLVNPTLVSVPNSSDVRVFFTSVGTPAGPSAMYVARWKSDNVFSCGACKPIGFDGTTSKIATSVVVPDLTLGTLGYLPLENQKDVVFVHSNYDNAGTPASQLGLINIESEAIQVTDVDSINHLWRPSFAK